MLRNTIRQLGRQAQTLRDSWFARPFAHVFIDPRLWSMQRRSITAAFGIGLAICFIPLPVHIPVAFMLAMLLRLNVPTLIGTVFIVNPITVVPIYYLAYVTGRMALGQAPGKFRFELSWDWLQNGLGPVWKPFLLGCLICSVVFGLAGWFLLDRIWRSRVLKKYRERRHRSNA
ncbi:MAG: DUF2062 domain-containing protein [Gammaproteobacteria bacterium]